MSKQRRRDEEEVELEFKNERVARALEAIVIFLIRKIPHIFSLSLPSAVSCPLTDH